MASKVVEGSEGAQEIPTDHVVENVSLAGVRDAAERIKPYVHRTPVLTSEAINEMSGGRSVFFKCELFQKTGSFKARGACNAVMQAPPDCEYLVTHSSGNHAQAIAWAAKTRGLKARIVMTTISPEMKKAAVRGYGAVITPCEPVKLGRERAAEALMATLPNHRFVSSSNDPKIICGQGTLALELVEQVKEMCGASLDAVIVPVGGGGMISGVTVVVKALCPGIRVIGAEPAMADDAFRSKTTGELCFLEGAMEPDTIADGLRINLGSLTWPFVRDHVDEIVPVSEEEIKRWMKVIYERMKLTIEPSAAVGVAALMSPQVRSLPASVKRIGVVLCGGNLDVTKLGDLLGDAPVKEG